MSKFSKHALFDAMHGV